MNFRKHHSSPNGFATVLTLLGMLLVAVSLPIATKLVQQNQDNRSSAAIDGTYDDINGGHEPECDKNETRCINGFINTCNTSYRWVKTTEICSDPKVIQGVPLCTTVRYGNWSDCVNGKQTRTVTKEPSNCSGGVTVLSNIQNCTVPVTCTYFTTTYWGACNKFADGYFQTRNVKGYPDGCTGGTPPPDKQSCCTSTDCGACGNPSACRSSGCYWETQMKVCTSKITENLPNPLCDGAMTGSKKCSNTTTLAKCGEKGWEFEYCNSWKSESCIDNKCQNINEYKKNFTSCTSSTFLGYKTYDSTSCPKGYSCDRVLEICKPIEELTVKKAPGSPCDTDADCQSGYCTKLQGGSVMNFTGKYCGDSSDKEQIIEDVKVTGVELAVVAALTTGGVVVSVGGPTAAALMVSNWMAANPGIMSKIQTASNIADIAEYISGTIACAVNPNSILCQNLADNMAVPGMAGLADSAADVIDTGVDAVIAANSAAKATNAVIKTTDGFVSYMGRPVGNILGTAPNGSRLVTVGGITYVDNSRAFVDIYEKYGLDSKAGEYELKSRIQSISYPNGYSPADDLVSAFTGVNSKNNDAITDYLALDLNTIAKDYDLPNPVDYDSAYIFQKDLLNNRQVDIVAGVDEIQKFDLENNESMIEHVENTFKDGNRGGFFSPDYPDTIFSVEDKVEPYVAGHEILHVEQYKYNRLASRAGNEYQAYLYTRYIQYLQGVAGDNDIVAELTRGIEASTKKTTAEILGLN